MEDSSLPGYSKKSISWKITDPSRFIQSIPLLVARLRMRDLNISWFLDLSPASLQILDRYTNSLIEQCYNENGKIFDNIDENLLEEITAYIGEVVTRNANGRWFSKNSRGHGPVVSFRIANIQRTIEPFEDVIEMFSEGGTNFAEWYKALTD